MCVYIYICMCVYVRMHACMCVCNVRNVCNVSSCPAGHLRHRAYCVLCSLSSLSPCLLVSLSPCRPVSLSLFFSYESLAETKPTKPQKLQKRNIQNCSKIMQNRCPWGHFGVILVSIWCPWGSFGDPGRPRGPPKGTEAKKRRKRAFADPPPGPLLGTLGRPGPPSGRHFLRF